MMNIQLKDEQINSVVMEINFLLELNVEYSLIFIVKTER